MLACVQSTVHNCGVHNAVPYIQNSSRNLPLSSLLIRCCLLGDVDLSYEKVTTYMIKPAKTPILGADESSDYQVNLSRPDLLRFFLHFLQKNL